jgi:hypothetical protein
VDNALAAAVVQGVEGAEFRAQKIDVLHAPRLPWGRKHAAHAALAAFLVSMFTAILTHAWHKYGSRFFG